MAYLGTYPIFKNTLKIERRFEMILAYLAGLISYDQLIREIDIESLSPEIRTQIILLKGARYEI